MVRFFGGLGIAVYFFTWIDILIWQRIFEANKLWDLGIGIYHQGWTWALFGFMALGMLFLFPDIRRMIMFPISLALLAFSGLEDVLYYWLDHRQIPDMLPWLSTNPLVIQPVTRTNLLLSAALWIFAIFLLEVLGDALVKKLKKVQLARNLNTFGLIAAWVRSLFPHKEKASE